MTKYQSPMNQSADPAENRAGLKGETSPVGGSVTISPGTCSHEASLDLRQQFIDKYQIREIGKCQVSVTLAEGITPAEFISEVVALSKAIDNTKAWYADEGRFGETHKYNSIIHSPLELQIDGHVEGSVGLTCQEQLDRGWDFARQWQAVVAHGAYYILTGKDLFDGKSVRTWERNASGITYEVDRLQFSERGEVNNDVMRMMGAYEPYIHGRDYAATRVLNASKESDATISQTSLSLEKAKYILENFAVQRDGQYAVSDDEAALIKEAIRSAASIPSSIELRLYYTDNKSALDAKGMIHFALAGDERSDTFSLMLLDPEDKRVSQRDRKVSPLSFTDQQDIFFCLGGGEKWLNPDRSGLESCYVTPYLSLNQALRSIQRSQKSLSA